jgi:hypothetical protein
MAAVALGLRLGAPETVRAAVVTGAPPASGSAAVFVEVAVFEEDHGMRAALSDRELTVVASGLAASQWSGRTNADGVAEVPLPIPSPRGLTLEVRLDGGVVARGPFAEEPVREAPDVPAEPLWMPFARRSGGLVLDVAVVGQRVAPGFPSLLCVRATDAVTHLSVTDVEIETDDDESLLEHPGAVRASSGWAVVRVVPVGLAVSLSLRARDSRGRTGEWLGGLFVRPGGAGVETRARWAPGDSPEVEVLAPASRSTLYLEVDDAKGRAWAATADRSTVSEGRHVFHVPPLPSGLYWAWASTSPAGAGGPWATVRPFFVATDQATALHLAPEEAAEVCAPGSSARSRDDATLWPCLALASAPPIARWVVLDGLGSMRDVARARRSVGLAVALGALVLCALLEGTLLWRAAALPRSTLEAISQDRGARSARIARASTFALGLLVALLGFALLAAFLVRAS